MEKLTRKDMVLLAIHHLGRNKMVISNDTIKTLFEKHNIKFNAMFIDACINLLTLENYLEPDKNSFRITMDGIQAIQKVRTRRVN